MFWGSDCRKNISCCYSKMHFPFFLRQTREALVCQEGLFRSVRMWHLCHLKCVYQSLNSPWRKTYHRQTWALENAPHKRLSESLLSPLISHHFSQWRADYQQIFVCRGPRVVEFKKLREAHVNNSKPIKITLHLSCDLYWLVFQFSSVKPADCLEGLDG